MALRKEKTSNSAQQMTAEQKQEIVQALQCLKPQTKMGQKLIELSLKGVQAGDEPMNTDEILAYLGRNKSYENIH